MSLDLSFLGESHSGPFSTVQIGERTHQVPLSTDMDLISSLKDFHGALRTWPKKTVEARWELFEKIRGSLLEDKEEIARIMTAERGEELSQREHQELFKALTAWRVEEFTAEFEDQGRFYRRLPLGICAVLLDERHPWISWLSYAVRAVLTGSVVAVRFLPENIQTAAYLASKLKDWELDQGRMKLFAGAGGSWDEMACSHPATALVVVECADWERAFYKKLLSATSKRYALLSPTRTVALLLEESSRDRAQQIIQRVYGPTLGFERLGRLFTLDKFYEGWKNDLESALADLRPQHLPAGRSEIASKWEEQKSEILKEKNVTDLAGKGLQAFDFSNCAPIHQKVLYGPFLSLTRSKYVHEAIKFAQTTPLKSHAVLVGPADKMKTWSGQLGFQNVWCNTWPKWDLEQALSPGFSAENLIVGAGKLPELFFQLQVLRDS